MINWKKVAKYLFSERNNYKKMWEEENNNLRIYGHMLAKAAGTPTPKETNVSIYDMYRLACERLKITLPVFVHNYNDKSEADVRILQAQSRIRYSNDSIKVIKYGKFGRWLFLKLIKGYY